MPLIWKSLFISDSVEAVIELFARFFKQQPSEKFNIDPRTPQANLLDEKASETSRPKTDLQLFLLQKNAQKSNVKL